MFPISGLQLSVNASSGDAQLGFGLQFLSPSLTLAIMCTKIHSITSGAAVNSRLEAFYIL